MKHLFQQSIAVSPSTTKSVDRHGQETFSSSTTIAARFEPYNRRMLDASGKEYQSDARVYCEAVTGLQVDDKVTYAGVDYKIKRLDQSIDSNGAIHHLELVLVRWRP